VCLAPLFALEDSCRASVIASERILFKHCIRSGLSHTYYRRMVSKPQITYDDGQLTIVAENCDFRKLCRTPRRHGSRLDLPASVAGQRFGFGLDPDRLSVLRDLLDNTELDTLFNIRYDLEGIRSCRLLCAANGGTSVPGSRVARGTSRRELPVSSQFGGSSRQEGSTPAESAAVFPKQPQPGHRRRQRCGVCSSQLQSRARWSRTLSLEQARFGNI